jgi:hypothetical protein
MSGARTSYIAAVALTCLSAMGCAGPQRVNPSFSIPLADAERELKAMQQAPVEADRPLVILGGINDPGYLPKKMQREIGAALHGRSTTVIYPFATRFEQCRRKVINTVDREFGVVSPDETVEVDVVAQSMGGVVALFSALPDPILGKRLKIRRLYTISSPLNGARRANALAWISPVSLHRDLRTNSPLQDRLRTAGPVPFEVVSYSRLNDDTVGARYACLPEAPGVWWLDNPPLSLPHTGCFSDPRIVGDIIRRLRNETPFTVGSPTPVPEEEPQ